MGSREIRSPVEFFDGSLASSSAMGVSADFRPNPETVVHEFDGDGAEEPDADEAAEEPDTDDTDDDDDEGEDPSAVSVEPATKSTRRKSTATKKSSSS